MTTNSTFRIAELDPADIKNNLKNYLRSQSEFTDYDFEGSGMNILLDLLAYNTHYMSFYMNMLGAEAFHDSAQLRTSLASHAKHIGYVPQSTKPSRTVATITVTPSEDENQETTTLILPRWTSFQSQADDGINYNFVAVNSNTAIKTANTFTFANVILKQGEIISRTYLADSNNPKREYFIPTANVDIDELYVTVQESASNTNYEIYNKFQDLTELKSNSQVFFIEENTISNSHYKLFFGDGYLGKRPVDGNIITLTYLVTDGKYGNGANSFILVENINGYDDNVTISTSNVSAGGADKESLEEIRYRSPRWYTAQNRAVIKNDYQILLARDYPNIQSIAVWGGEENDPPIYGKVFISLKPNENYYITNIEKQQILDDIVKTRSVMTVIPEIINPDYTYLVVRAKVYYDKTATNLDTSQIKAGVRQSILNYRDNNLQKFESKFRISRLQRDIENSNPAINSATVDIFVQKRLIPDFGTTKNYSLDYKTVLDKEELYTFPTFQYIDGDGDTRDCYLEEIPRSFTGIDGIEIVNSGNDYLDAIVTITGDGSGAEATARIVNRKIESIDLNSRGSNYTKATVSITSNTGFGAVATARLQFNLGELRAYYFRDNGEKVIINDNAGTINYNTGQITIDNFKFESISSSDRYNDDILTINVKPRENDISPKRNSIIDLDENDSSSIVITMVEE